MTDETFRRPFEGEDAERGGLPDHEYSEGEAVGAGVMGAGGTAVDRGTGSLGGEAQGERDEDRDDDLVRPDDRRGTGDEGIEPGVIPGMPAGGATPYVPAAIVQDETVTDERGE